MSALTFADATVAAGQATEPWNSHDTRLIIVTVLGIAIIVLLITVLKMHPFLALMLGSAFVGFAAGVGAAKIVTNFEAGVGATLQEVGLLIALGAMLGKLLADSGGADQIIDTLLSRTPPKLVPWAMSLVAVIIGLPMFFEIGLVLLLPVIVLVSQRAKLKLMRVAIPALAGLSALHGLVPPHPGPLIAISAVHAQLGITLALGLLIAIPTVVICGPLLAIPITRWVPVDPPALAGGVDTTKGKTQSEDVKRPPSFLVTLLTILFPVMLMLGKAVADVVWDADPKNPPPVRVFFDFVGEPLVALTLGVLLAMVTFGYAVGFTGNSISSRIGASVGPIAAVLLIVGAGGGFKQTLIGAGVGGSVAKFANGANISVLVLGYLIAVALRLATGSATVATITAAGIVAPLATDLSSTHAALLALAIGSGSLFFSHVNDAGFWLVKELFGLSIGQTFKSWSVMETAVSVVGFSFVMALSTVL
ncbi:gluconate:H+ symporter, GntP family [Frankineae bacterium MT45]|nr:gluconate:H+ symporter, GntP family [Frankineae bacterium MT45]